MTFEDDVDDDNDDDDNDNDNDDDNDDDDVDVDDVDDDDVDDDDVDDDDVVPVPADLSLMIRKLVEAWKCEGRDENSHRRRDGDRAAGRAAVRGGE